MAIDTFDVEKVEDWLQNASDEALQRVLLQAERVINERRLSSASRKPSLSNPTVQPASSPAKLVRGSGRSVLSPARSVLTPVRRATNCTSKPEVLRRLQEEYHQVIRDQPTHCSASPAVHGDLSRWKATIMGPEGTPYHGGLFHLELAFPPNYPFTGPKVTFKTPIFHPSIDQRVNLRLLEEDWVPECTIVQVLVSICLMLVRPGSCPTLGTSESCIQARALFASNRPQFEHLAKQWTVRHAMR